jgi:protein-(glutamine-N5) methyltransferase, release factor-specific
VTVRECKNTIAKMLEEADIESAFLEASIFIRKATAWTRTEELMKDRDELDPALAEKALSMAKQRARHVPSAYITGEKEFYGRTFSVSPSVLIPRPDTETLIERALEEIDTHHSNKVLDLCTGSGAVGLTLLSERDIDITLTDISPEALATAMLNKEHLLPERKAVFCLGDLFDPIPGLKFDLIVSNPPYVTRAWYEKTEEEVKKEPTLALIDYDEDGLGIIRRIIKGSLEALNNGGVLMFECDYRQTGDCAKILENSGFTDIFIQSDLSGKPRVAGGRLCTRS